jgi:hypothetical protein
VVLCPVGEFGVAEVAQTGTLAGAEPRVSGAAGKVTSSTWWIQRETPKHLELLTRLREKLEMSLEPQPDLERGTGLQRVNGEGRPMWLPADVNESNVPTRTWCRVLQRYQTGWAGVVNAEIQIRKLQLLAQRHAAGQPPLTDEEYAREMAELGREAIAELSDGELEREIARRRGSPLAMMAPVPDD